MARRASSSLRLVLMRHAKSSWDNPGLADHARPLNKRGKNDAPRMARALRARGWAPDAVLSSDSRRTRDTWSLMAPELRLPPEPEFTRDLYFNDPIAVARQRAAAGAFGKTRTLMLLGHCPWWDEAALALTGCPVDLKTASALLLESELTARGVGWADALTPGAGWDICELIHPRELANDDPD